MSRLGVLVALLFIGFPAMAQQPTCIGLACSMRHDAALEHAAKLCEQIPNPPSQQCASVTAKYRALQAKNQNDDRQFIIDEDTKDNR